MSKAVGISSFAINGIALSIPEDAELTYSIPINKKEYLRALQGVENVTSFEPTPGTISTSIRYTGLGINPSFFAGFTDAVVTFTTRDGILVTASGCLFGDAIRINPKDGTADLEISCLSIIEV
ncbi:hypothetical protein HLH26_05615 [Gluconacetobacter sp. 1b LMG 1731]|uniref:Uncharacterized protein n=1 Tax=Gluconacetobacter dulcium TaxID=2729096 RepID=A0A7W4NRX6_9PROT|nr:phage tail tube protein [Gluconacetobacter dulcium]MBB2164021.1 hypothetical protein [Gluconacetobacter dulcium]MBB2192725.1 hypothetical protein [Gluconacetobacter dulcium]